MCGLRCVPIAFVRALGFARARAPRALSASAVSKPGPHVASDDTGFLLDHVPATSAYVHLPFCKRKCLYCDFPVQAVGVHTDRAFVQDTMADYVDVLCREIRATSAEGSAPLRTVFFGGGTPSLVRPELMGRVLEELDRQFGMAAGCEVGMEVDPGTFDARRLCDFLALGVTRVSVGVQSFDEDLLRACGRSHSAADVVRALEDVRDSGVRSWSLDLMSALPGLGEAAWARTLSQAIAWGPDHVSVYDLQVEEGTPFARMYQPGTPPLPTEEASASMFREASRALCRAGYEHYEVSNYAKPGHRCAHNQVYWRGMPFLAFGLGAASYLRRTRFSRPKTMRAYRAWVDALEQRAQELGRPTLPGPLSSAHPSPEPDTPQEVLLDMVMLRLRTADGLSLAQVQERFGAPARYAIATAATPLAARGLATLSADVLRLTDPEGFLVSNAVIAELFAALDAAPIGDASWPSASRRMRAPTPSD